MMTYDPNTTPAPAQWFALDEARRLELVSAYHHRTRVKLPNAQLRTAVHVIVENQLAEEIALVRDTLNRLMGEGLDRHGAIHAIGSVPMGHLWRLLREGAKAPDPHEPYFQRS